MDIGRRSFPLPSLNPMKYKQRVISQQNPQPANVTRQPRQTNGEIADSQIANLKQCISAYLDSIQTVCRAGTWLAETFSFLLNDSPGGTTAVDMRSKFAKMLEASISTTLQAKNNLSVMLTELSFADLNCNNQSQVVAERRLINTKVLENCIYCLSEVHNSFFKFELDVKVDLQSKGTLQQSEATSKMPESQDSIPNDNPTATANHLVVEYERLADVPCNTKSWQALKQTNMCLRKYNGLTGNEIQNLLKHGTVSDLYLEKLNQRIDTALRNYEVGLRANPAEFTIVFGGFHSDTSKAKAALLGCCSQSEMEQGTQRLPVSQFLHCELPLMAVTVNRRDYVADTKNLSTNVNQKKNAVRQLLQSANQKLSISETDDLASEILGDVCPARWRNHVKATLQLLYGNSGLIIMDTVSGDSNNAKRNAVISIKDNFIVVSVTSTWCLKEDPGTMSLLQRNLDPEKTLATIHVRYVSVFYNKVLPSQRSDPGIFVETFLQTGSENRRRASQTLRATQTLCGVPLTPVSACWLTGQPLAADESPVLSTRSLPPADADEVKGQRKAGPDRTCAPAKFEDGDARTDRKRTKKLVVEIKEADSSGDEGKLSDNDDSVKDVIHMLSGSGRANSRRRQAARTGEKAGHDQDTDELSKATEDILDEISDCNSTVKTPQRKIVAAAGQDAQCIPERHIQSPYADAVTLGTGNPGDTQFQLKSYQREPTKSQTLPGAAGRTAETNETAAKSHSNTLPPRATDLTWGSPFARLTPPLIAPALSARPAGQALPNRFAPSYFTAPASTPPYSHASPSISPRPNLSLAQSALSNQYDAWTRPKNFQADRSLMGGVFQNQPDLIRGPNQSREKIVGPNLNNNNFAPGMRESRSLPRPGPRHFGDLNRSASVSTDAMPRNFASNAAPMLFQNSLRLNENMDARGTLVGNAMPPRSPGPVGSRQRKVEAELLQQQQHTSNTWPFLQEFGGFPADNAGGKDRDYQKYVAELRNAALRKQTQSPAGHPFDTADVVAWNNRILWENQCLEQPPPNPGSFSNANGNGSATGTGDVLSSISDMSSDQFKTGTWPGTFQLWPTSNDNAGIWEWRNDSGRDGE